MQTTVAEVDVARARIARVNVGELRLGPIDIGQLVVNDASVTVEADQAQLRNVVVTIRLRFVLVWTIRIPLPWPFDDIVITEQETGLGAFDLPFPFGDATVPGLENIRFTIPQLTAANTTVEVDPISGLQLTDVQAEGLRIADIALPTAGFQLGGLGLTAVNVREVGVPAADVGRASIRRVTGPAVTVPTVRLRGLNLPAASANDVTSGVIDLTVQRDEPIEVPPSPLGLGVLTVQLRIEASARTRVAQMRLSDVSAGVRAGSIEVRDVRVPYSAVEVTLSDLGLETIDVPLIGVS